MIIDLHIHTANYSKGAVSSADEVMAAAIDRGLGGVVITEHMLVWPDVEFQALRRRFPRLTIFRGIEVSTSDGEDLLLYGLRDHAAFASRLPAETVIAQAHADGGAVVLAHGFRYRDTVADALYQSSPDACDVWSHNIFDCQRSMIHRYAAAVDCGLLAATDSHCAANVGAFAIRIDQPLRDEADLAKALCKRAYTPFIDHIRAGRTPRMLDPDNAAAASDPELHLVH